MDLDPTPLVMNWRSTALALPLLCTAVCWWHLYAREVERPSVAWLGAFLVCAAISLLPQIIGFAGAYDRWPYLTFAPMDWSLWFAPTLYLHVHSLMLSTPPTGRWWWFAPGALYAAYQLWAFLLPDVATKWSYNDAVHEPYVLPVIFAIGLGLIALALVGMGRLRRRYLRWLENHHADGARFEPRWLTRIAYVALPLTLVWALEVGLGNALELDYVQRYGGNFLAAFLLFLLSSEALAGLDRPFPKMDASPADTTAAPPDESPRDWREEGERLRSATLAEGWHLQSGLSLERLARHYGMNQSYVSRSLNQGLGQSFSHFVNALRVDHAKTLLGDSTLSVLDIALRSGFGSKASFNRAFREHAGATPSHVRKALLGTRERADDEHEEDNSTDSTP